MRHSNARGIGPWSRSNLFDGWQVLGTIGLLAGALAFGALISHIKPNLPSTGSTIHLLQTFVSHSPFAQPSTEPTVEPWPSPGPEAVSPATGRSEAPVPSASRSGSTRNPTPARSPAPVVPTASALPVPIPSVSPSSTARPCFTKVCP